ncbi:MAG: glycosyltransferase family 2 protein [Methanomassiliicoccus sp.]|nr:glycosyltransferase family 2 protein [Methanomassiliicoccus sp.]
MYRQSTVAVVIPAYNEEELIQDTLSGIPSYVDRVYVVNDGSKDGTEERVQEFSSRDPRFVYIRHETNKGVGAAIVTGYSRSFADKMDITAVMAGDNQMDPRELPKLLDPIVNGEADYAKGHRLESRTTAKGMSDFRYLGNNILTFLTRFAAGNNKINDPQNGYTAISNHVFKKMSPGSIFTWYGYCNDMLVKLSTYGFKIKDVVIPARYGRERSKIAYPKYIIRISRLLFNELIWRLNYQNMSKSARKANSVMVIGGGMSSMSFTVATLSLITPLSIMGTPKPAESPVGMLIVLSLVGLGMAYLGFVLKRGGKIGMEGKKV